MSQVDGKEEKAVGSHVRRSSYDAPQSTFSGHRPSPVEISPPYSTSSSSLASFHVASSPSLSLSSPNSRPTSPQSDSQRKKKKWVRKEDRRNKVARQLAQSGLRSAEEQLGEQDATIQMLRDRLEQKKEVKKRGWPHKFAVTPASYSVRVVKRHVTSLTDTFSFYLYVILQLLNIIVWVLDGDFLRDYWEALQALLNQMELPWIIDNLLSLRNMLDNMIEELSRVRQVYDLVDEWDVGGAIPPEDEEVRSEFANGCDLFYEDPYLVYAHHTFDRSVKKMSGENSGLYGSIHDLLSSFGVEFKERQSVEVVVSLARVAEILHKFETREYDKHKYRQMMSMSLNSTGEKISPFVTGVNCSSVQLAGTHMTRLVQLEYGISELVEGVHGQVYYKDADFQNLTSVQEGRAMPELM